MITSFEEYIKEDVGMGECSLPNPIMGIERGSGDLPGCALQCVNNKVIKKKKNKKKGHIN